MSEITPDMSMAKIQSILDKAGDIQFKKGSYKITKTLYINSKTFIDCEQGTVFQKACAPSMFMTNCSSVTTKYQGAHDITWYGGEVYSNVTSKTQSNLFTLFHAKNVIIRDLHFRKDFAQHCIEINACKNVKINGCKFVSHNPPKAYKEAIQLDFANYAGFTFAGADAPCYDGTHCQDIEISGCEFTNVAHAIGTHTVYHGDKAHKNIVIVQNDYRGTAKVSSAEEKIFVKLLNMQNVVVEDNGISYANIGVKLNATKTETEAHGGTVKVDVGKRNKNVIVDGNWYDSVTQEVVVV